MSLNNLPEVSYVDSDVEEIERGIIEGYEALSERVLFPGDPIRLFLESLALIIMQQRALINIVSKQNLLKYANDEVLDNLGALSKTDRLTPKKASTILKFTISDIQQNIVIIPQGTKATAGDNVYFETINPYEIKPGELSIEAEVYCTEDGEIGNGYGINTIKNIVDVFPYFKEVTNITESSGGADLEEDDNYRERIHLAPEGFSTAGPELGYKYHAKSTDIRIIDAIPYSPSEGKVNVVILAKEETEELLQKVRDNCNDRYKRPLTDLVTVMFPEKINYDINIKFWIDRNNETQVSQIRLKVDEAIQFYIEWQTTRLGRNINPSKLIQLVMGAGASRVEVIAPLYQDIKDTQIANAGTITALYGGIEND